nr:immunoglobulin light chain junction region [Macaca mulatta]
CQQHNSYPSTF